jgi:uncharacterized repeat protein (TIGR03803 family)
MTNTVQHRARISRIRLGTASAALTLAVLLGLGLTAPQSAQAETFTVLYNFYGWPDGQDPSVAMIRDAAGNLYGTTATGGVFTWGTVFKVSKSGSETVLYSFCSASNCSDGELPRGGLTRDSKGNLYGTTSSGGASSGGAVFELSKSGKETVLYSFCTETKCADGSYPNAGLIRDSHGNLYGTTAKGGAYGNGVVFKLDATGSETVLYSFTGGADGSNPYAGVIRDAAGNLYGTTSSGGSSGYGLVFMLSTTGTLTVLHSFAGGTTDGCNPLGTPVMDDDGNLYGTTSGCGSSGSASYGIVWKVTANSTETVLHNFAGYPSDGAVPWAGVILDAKGNLYGVTSSGGASSVGTVYELRKKGSLTLLHSFDGLDGEYAYGGLVRDAKGNLYGTAVEGGEYHYGTVWKITK